MNPSYTATIYCGEEIIAYKHGEDIEELYLWMLTHVNEKFGSARGEVLEIKTHTVVRQFRKSSLE